MPRFFVTVTGSLTARWAIEIDAETEELAKKEALLSAPDDPNLWDLSQNPVTGFEVVEEVELLTPEIPDRDLGRRELETKYSAGHSEGCGHHPTYTRDMWKAEVGQDDTVMGYWDWVYNCLANE